MHIWFLAIDALATLDINLHQNYEITHMESRSNQKSVKQIKISGIDFFLNAFEPITCVVTKWGWYTEDSPIW